ncbi:hypothetical protein CC80DRAFT_509097 [Byssothecium circinans]|uniref:Uncharacterized protein n=1 Tax=Byssothecium circinans TaxID=147558 RepID=A0A6A5TEJ2_9PLEO|nr:hypothetical protein CC80DRAFT_509097 [Byssothecium circinans]
MRFIYNAPNLHFQRTPQTTGSIPTDRNSVRIGIGSVAQGEGYSYRMRPLLNEAYLRFTEVDNALQHIADAPLLTRAWAYQERLLPVRTLHLHAEQLIWECKSGLRCECGSLDHPELKRAEFYNLQDFVYSPESRRWLKPFVALRVDQPPAREPTRRFSSQLRFSNSQG